MNRVERQESWAQMENRAPSLIRKQKKVKENEKRVAREEAQHRLDTALDVFDCTENGEWEIYLREWDKSSRVQE